jgi:hypothetical protein
MRIQIKPAANLIKIRDEFDVLPTKCLNYREVQEVVGRGAGRRKFFIAGKVHACRGDEAT